ncbi:hypothetical protein BV20DRAFT_960636 [Pilatotrama ljubarskyi]|nr:hypothetical protein BV20DRAFT_960636 [Pilatotrama ljubarskyi]
MSTVEGTVALNNCRAIFTAPEPSSPSTAVDLQSKGRVASLSWEDEVSGPRHAPQWTCRCKIDGEILATGTGSRRAAAQDVAATEALAILIARESQPVVADTTKAATSPEAAT